MTRKALFYLVIFVCMIFIIFRFFIEGEEAFNPKTVHPGSESDYDMKLAMSPEGLFSADVSITMTNKSNEAWEDLIFYFIPNMFTSENASGLDIPSDISIESVQINNNEISYTLQEDTLNVTLKEKIAPNEGVSFQMKYKFTLPKDGYRFTQIEENYMLAQWYPMAATYRNGWNKQPFSDRGESYHTSFSNFNIEYHVPEDYTVVTTSDTDTFPSINNQSVQAEQVKEFFIAILNKPKIIERNVDDVNIRVFTLNETEEELMEIIQIAVDSFEYFQNKIGIYPSKQLDIVLVGLGMEYPGIVTAGSLRGRDINFEEQKRMVVHEIAHQWFYGLVSNDPYFHAWLDEGLAELATAMFRSKESGGAFQEYSNQINPMPSNLALHDYSSYSSNYIYGQSYAKLAQIFNQHGGIKTAENFLKEYFNHYKYKEVDTDEFVRFMKHYLELKDNSLFEDWLELE